MDYLKDNETRYGILSLPVDILLLVLQKIKTIDIVRMLRTCKYMYNNFSNEQSLWKHEVVRTYHLLKDGFKRDLIKKLEEEIFETSDFRWKQHLIGLYKLRFTLYVSIGPTEIEYFLKTCYTDSEIGEYIYEPVVRNLDSISRIEKCYKVMTIGPIKNANISLLLQWIFVFHYQDFSDYCHMHFPNVSTDTTTLLLAFADIFKIEYKWASVKTTDEVREKAKTRAILNITNKKQQYINIFQAFIDIKATVVVL
jgi:hypothetical protein